MPHIFAAPDNTGLYILHDDTKDGVAQQEGEACQGEERDIAYDCWPDGNGDIMKQLLQPYNIEAVIEIYRKPRTGIEVDKGSKNGALIEPATYPRKGLCQYHKYQGGIGQEIKVGRELIDLHIHSVAVTAYAIDYHKKRYGNDNPAVYGRLFSIIEPGKGEYRIAENLVGKEGYRHDSTAQQQIGIRRPEVLLHDIHNRKQCRHNKIYGDKPQGVEFV